jgi:hypothetical protein
MKIALDRKGTEVSFRKAMGEPVLQLRTPLTGYAKLDGLEWVMDNGSFSEFHENRFTRMAMNAMTDPDCKWIALPDIVGDFDATLKLFNLWSSQLEKAWIPCRDHFKKWAFVVQDGATIEAIPWDEIVAVFLGGTTKFKLSRGAYVILEAAKQRGKWVHVGRVNTSGRIGYFHGIADSIDGSGIARFHTMYQRAVNIILHLNGRRNTKLEEWY